MKQLILLAAVLLMIHGQGQAEEVDFAKQVLPILQDRCFDCHGPDKQKGDLRLDTKDGMFHEDDMVVAGKPDDSELVMRISLPADDEERMPAKGDPLTNDQIELFRAWITTGAVWPEGLTTSRPPAPKRESPLDSLPPIEPTADEAAAIDQLAQLGLSVRPVAAKIIWKTANFRGLAREQLAEAIGLLSRVTTLTELNLADCQLADEDVASLSALTNLTRLHLEKNPITDAALAHLAPLVHLDYLNLYGTQVTNAGLLQLGQMTQLRKLYVWQTHVTDEGVAALQNKLPNVDVVLGGKLVVIPPAENTTETKEVEPKAADNGDLETDAKPDQEPRDTDSAEPENG